MTPPPKKKKNSWIVRQSGDFPEIPEGGGGVGWGGRVSGATCRTEPQRILGIDVTFWERFSVPFLLLEE